MSNCLAIGTENCSVGLIIMFASKRKSCERNILSLMIGELYLCSSYLISGGNNCQF